MRTRTTASAASLVLLTGALFGCGTGNDDTPETADTADGTTDEDMDDAPAEEAPEDIEGTITVLTHRTDMIDNELAEYAERFNETYPNVEVKYEGLTDYEGEVQIRMNTEEYGDVLMVPGVVTPQELGDFFEPLGTVDELDEKYHFAANRSYDGVVYGLPSMGNTVGIVYNKRIFEEAGVTEWATSPEQFVADMQAVKDETGAIPVYTNYGAGWPLTQWDGNRGAISRDPDYTWQLANTDEVWTEGGDIHTIDSLIWDLVANGLTEEDPTTTDWEASKELLGRGEVAAMGLGSWSIVQMKDAAENPDDIDFMPFPYAPDGTFASTIGSDYPIGINKHSSNKEAARAYLDFFLDESGYWSDSGAISPLKTDPMPEELAGFEEMNVELIEMNQPPSESEGLFEEIDNAGEVGIELEAYKQRIVDAARGATNETLEEIFADLNSKWAAGRAAVTG
jgi:ABC-type glycerol-3-phosphate transport system substrate-binding protein